MGIGRLHNVVIDCPDPGALAAFYGELLGLPLIEDRGDWKVLGDRAGGVQVCFQHAPDLLEARWPDPERPQQLHFDVLVDDIDAAEAATVALGAKRLPGEGRDFRVFEDPSGHPFCLVWDA